MRWLGVRVYIGVSARMNVLDWDGLELPGWVVDSVGSGGGNPSLRFFPGCCLLLVLVFKRLVL